MYNKIKYLLTTKQKKEAVVLGVMMLIGMIIEMGGLAILMPSFSFLLVDPSTSKNKFIIYILKTLGNPKHSVLILYIMLTLIIYFVFKAIFSFYLIWRQSNFTSHISAELSTKLFKGYLNLPYQFHLIKNSSELLRNIQTEVALFTNVTQSIITVAIEVSVALGLFFVLVIAEPKGALIVILFFLIASMLFHRITRRKLLQWGEQRQNYSSGINKHLFQGLGGIKDLKLLGKEHFFLNEFTTQNNPFASISAKFLTLSQIPRIYLELLAIIGLASLIIFMVYQGGPITDVMPIIALFVAAAFRMMPSINRVIGAFQTIRYAVPVVNLLYNEFNIINNANTQIKKNNSEIINGNIEIKELDFQYETAERLALEKINIKIDFNSTVGFIGESGSGKSTMIDLLLGLLSPINGEILVAGTNISDNLSSWQTKIGYVPQSIYLTDDSIKNNIAFGIKESDINVEALNNAVKTAQLETFIQSLPNGLNTEVGERGVRLSGGQRQRIGLARALYRNPDILVLDEATSALDVVTESEIMEAIKRLKGKKTIIIVAHRYSTVNDCDIIYKFSQGKIIKSGKPEIVLV